MLDPLVRSEAEGQVAQLRAPMSIPDGQLAPHKLRVEQVLLVGRRARDAVEVVERKRGHRLPRELVDVK